MGRLLRRIWYVLRARRVAADLDEELALHRQLLEEEQHREGRRGPDVDAAVSRRLGSGALAQDETRDAILPVFIGDLMQDVRFAVRLLASDRRFTAAAVLALGLGMGVTGSVFGVINAALLRDLPFERPDRLIDITLLDRNGRSMALSPDEHIALNCSVKGLEGIGDSMQGVMNVSDEGRPPERLRGTFISANTLDLLRARPLLGRGFLAEDARPGAPPVVLLGHAVWTSRYASDPSIVGRTIRINNIPTGVIGVMPEGFSFPFIAEAWQLLSASPEVSRSPGTRMLRGAFGRLADGVDEPRAQHEIEAVALRLMTERSDRPGAARIQVTPLKSSYAQGTKGALLTFLGAVAVVLLVACANVANLLLARSASRSREMAVRASLGATRWRLVRQLLVECLVLALLGGLLGLALSRYGARAIAVAFSPIEPGVAVGALRPYWLDLSFDGTLLTFAGVAALFASLVFGLVPALQVARVDVNSVLKDGERGASARRTRRWTSVFLVSEMALTLVLLGAAGLLWRSFYVMYVRELGVDASGVVSMRLTLPVEKYDTPDKRRQFVSRLEAGLRDVSGFESTALATTLPFSFGAPSRTLSLDGVVAAPGVPAPSVAYMPVSDGYFEVLRLSLREGRAFRSTAASGGQTEAVVDQRFAALYFPGSSPVGRRIRLERPAAPGRASSGSPPPAWLTIVGVAPTIATTRPGPESAPVVYAAMRDDADPATTLSILVRSDRGAAASTAALRERVRTLDADLPLYAVETLGAVIAQSRAPQRLLGRWFAIIAMIALVLATVGIWGVTAHGITQRRREIGVRIALGARSSQIVWLFARGTGALVALGLALGAAGALMTGPLLRSFLVQTDARDPFTLLTVAALLSAVALAAALIPARRASRLDPVAALRRD